MKKITKKSTAITEMIEDDEGKKFIINRKHSVNVFTEPLDKTTFFLSESDWIEKDKYFREEIAKEVEEYKKKNPPLTKIEEEDLSNTSIRKQQIKQN